MFWRNKTAIDTAFGPTEVNRQLPKTLPEFEEWSNRIIKIANLPTSNTDTQKFALAGMLLQCRPETSAKSDIFFANNLRKAATDQLANQVIDDLRAKRQARIEAEKISPVKLANLKDEPN